MARGKTVITDNVVVTDAVMMKKSVACNKTMQPPPSCFRWLHYAHCMLKLTLPCYSYT